MQKIITPIITIPFIFFVFFQLVLVDLGGFLDNVVGILVLIWVVGIIVMNFVLLFSSFRKN